MIQDVFQRVAREFVDARAGSLANHPLANYLRDDAAQEVRDAISRPDLRVVGAPGQGNWADVPWLALFNPEVTTSATRGYDIVYLFAADMSTVTLSLAQGVTAIRDEFKNKAAAEMLRRAALIRDRVPEFFERFIAGPIQLKGTTQLAKDYDTAVAFCRSYVIGNLPDEGRLIADLQVMIRLCDLLVGLGGLDNVEGAIEHGADQDETAVYRSVEERRRYVRHSRIERHSSAAKLAKKAHGYVCQCCGFDFSRVYAELGEKFIEAHHLVPLASLPEGQPVSMNPKSDFAVLCANCHRGRKGAKRICCRWIATQCATHTSVRCGRTIHCGDFASRMQEPLSVPNCIQERGPASCSLKRGRPSSPGRSLLLFLTLAGAVGTPNASTLGKKFYLASRNSRDFHQPTNSPLPSCTYARTCEARSSTRFRLPVGDKARLL
jgi:5-methylcytosine-specific restriction enzyme A